MSLFEASFCYDVRSLRVCFRRQFTGSAFLQIRFEDGAGQIIKQCDFELPESSKEHDLVAPNPSPTQLQWIASLRYVPFFRDGEPRQLGRLFCDRPRSLAMATDVRAWLKIPMKKEFLLTQNSGSFASQRFMGTKYDWQYPLL
jgi:hypothetical protein